jgi:hypothetical protein
MVAYNGGRGGAMASRLRTLAQGSLAHNGMHG